MRLISSILVLCVMLTGCLATTGPLGDRSSNKIHNLNLITSTDGPVKAGKVARRFELRPGDCASEDCRTSRERIELDMPWKVYNGQEAWFSWYMFIPEDTKFTKNASTSVGQLYQKGTPWRPFLQLDITGNVFHAHWHQLTRMRDGDISDWGDVTFMRKVDSLRGKWTQVMVHFIAKKDDGLLKIYLDGKLEREVANPVWTPADEYWGVKFGIYRSHLDRENTLTPTTIVFYDEPRFGRTRLDVDDQINPGLVVVD